MLCVFLPLPKEEKFIWNFLSWDSLLHFFRTSQNFNHILKQNLWRIDIVQDEFMMSLVLWFIFFLGGPFLKKYIWGLSLRKNWLHALCVGLTCSVLPFWTMWILEVVWKTENFPLLLLTIQATLPWMLLVRRHRDCKEAPGARERSRSGSVWWFDLGWTPGAYQSHSISPLLNQTGERKDKKRLMDQVKGKERSLSSYCHGQNRLNFGKLV